MGPGAPRGADESAGLRAGLPCSPPAAESASLTLTPSSVQEGASLLLETELARILQVSVPENGLHLRDSFQRLEVSVQVAPEPIRRLQARGGLLSLGTLGCLCRQRPKNPRFFTVPSERFSLRTESLSVCWGRSW